MTDQEVQQPKPTMSGARRWQRTFEDVAKFIDGAEEKGSFQKYVHFLYFIQCDFYTDPSNFSRFKLADFGYNCACNFAAILRSILGGTVRADAGYAWPVRDFITLINSHKFKPGIRYPSDVFDCFFSDISFDAYLDFPRHYNAPNRVELIVSNQKTYKEYIGGLLMYFWGDSYTPPFEEDENPQPAESFKFPEKYALEAAKYAQFESDFFCNSKKYKHLRYGQAFSDYFKLEKMNDEHDSRISKVYQLDGAEAKKFIFSLFEFN